MFDFKRLKIGTQDTISGIFRLPAPPPPTSPTTVLIRAIYTRKISLAQAVGRPIAVQTPFVIGSRHNTQIIQTIPLCLESIEVTG